jgi:iron complex outermembrane receptor protein
VSALPVDSVAGIALGAKALKPERSVNYSVGFVFNAIPRFNLTVDAYQIKLKDRILLSSTLQGTLVRNVLAASGITASAGGFYFSNSTDTRTRGIDIVGTYRASLGDFGTANLSLSANFNETIFTRVDSVPAVLAGAGLVLIGRDRQGDFTKGTPRNKIIANVAWEKGPATFNLRATRYGSVTQMNASATGLDATIDPKVILDLDASYKITDGIKLAVGANNLLNTYPNTLPASLQGNGFTLYNAYSPYGVSGGFYYARASFSF